MATGAENQAAWAHARTGLQLGKRVRLPVPLEFRRPDDKEPPPPKVVSDPGEIAAFFRKHIG